MMVGIKKLGEYDKDNNQDKNDDDDNYIVNDVIVNHNKDDDDDSNDNDEGDFNKPSEDGSKLIMKCRWSHRLRCRAGG